MIDISHEPFHIEDNIQYCTKDRKFREFIYILKGQGFKTYLNSIAQKTFKHEIKVEEKQNIFLNINIYI